MATLVVPYEALSDGLVEAHQARQIGNLAIVTFAAVEQNAENVAGTLWREGFLEQNLQEPVYVTRRKSWVNDLPSQVIRAAVLSSRLEVEIKLHELADEIVEVIDLGATDQTIGDIQTGSSLPAIVAITSAADAVFETHTIRTDETSLRRADDTMFLQIDGTWEQVPIQPPEFRAGA